MLALYRSLLRMYPAEYFREYGAEMTWVFAQAKEAACAQSFRSRLLFYIREILGLISSALRQRLFGRCDWNSSRRFAMRPEFRFPRSTIFLMCVILAGVLLAIAEAKTVALPYGPTEVRSVWSMLPWFSVVAVVLVCVTVGVTWGILFALRRTGMQRLERLDTASNI
jgi:hypothetical protein